MRMRQAATAVALASEGVFCPSLSRACSKGSTADNVSVPQLMPWKDEVLPLLLRLAQSSFPRRARGLLSALHRAVVGVEAISILECLEDCGGATAAELASVCKLVEQGLGVRACGVERKTRHDAIAIRLRNVLLSGDERAVATRVRCDL